jgi:hypothetical protein
MQASCQLPPDCRVPAQWGFRIVAARSNTVGMSSRSGHCPVTMTLLATRLKQSEYQCLCRTVCADHPARVLRSIRGLRGDAHGSHLQGIHGALHAPPSPPGPRRPNPLRGLPRPATQLGQDRLTTPNDQPSLPTNLSLSPPRHLSSFRGPAHNPKTRDTLSRDGSNPMARGEADYLNASTMRSTSAFNVSPPAYGTKLDSSRDLR